MKLSSWCWVVESTGTYSRERVAILEACFVQVREVYAHPPFPIGFLDHHHVCQPVGVIYFSNKACLLQFANSFCYRSVPFLGKHPLLRRTPASSDGWVEKKTIHSACVPWLRGRFLACPHGSKRICPGLLWEKSWALGESLGWWGCRSLWFDLVWSRRGVSPRVFLLVPPLFGALLCSWSIDDRPSPASQYSIRAQLANLLATPLLHTRWGIWSSGGRSKLQPSTS